MLLRSLFSRDDTFALALSDDKRRGEIKDIKDFNDIKDAPYQL